MFALQKSEEEELSKEINKERKTDEQEDKYSLVNLVAGVQEQLKKSRPVKNEQSDLMRLTVLRLSRHYANFKKQPSGDAFLLTLQSYKGVISQLRKSNSRCDCHLSRVVTLPVLCLNDSEEKGIIQKWK